MSVIDFGLGWPDYALMPAGALARAAAQALAHDGAQAANYGPNLGPPALRNWIARHIAHTETAQVDPGQIFVTAGTSAGLDLLLTLFTRPNDVLLVESPTYHLALRMFRDHPLQVIGVDSDTGGMDIERLRTQIDQLVADGRPPRALYCVPTFNNPTGRSLLAERRVALVALAQTYGFTIFEDDTYRLLNYDGPALPSLWSLAAPGVVIRLATFAKTVAPGLRLGYLTASADQIRRIDSSGLLDSGGGVNHFTASIANCLCESGEFDRIVAGFRATYRKRRDALIDTLKSVLPAGSEIETPAGGFFVWVTLPEGFIARDLLNDAPARFGVDALSGERFFTANVRPERHIRLAFSYYAEDSLVEGARRLGLTLKTAVRTR
jgi:2-aminoadipate transaminase